MPRFISKFQIYTIFLLGNKLLKPRGAVCLIWRTFVLIRMMFSLILKQSSLPRSVSSLIWKYRVWRGNCIYSVWISPTSAESARQPPWYDCLDRHLCSTRTPWCLQYPSPRPHACRDSEFNSPEASLLSTSILYDCFSIRWSSNNARLDAVHTSPEQVEPPAGADSQQQRLVALPRRLQSCWLRCCMTSRSSRWTTALED